MGLSYSETLQTPGTQSSLESGANQPTACREERRDSGEEREGRVGKKGGGGMSVGTMVNAMCQ